MRFLRSWSLLLKRLYKKIPFANDANLSPEEYNYLSNTTYNNDEGWQQIADDFQFAYDNLPVKQADKGRPPKPQQPPIWQRLICTKLIIRIMQIAMK